MAVAGVMRSSVLDSADRLDLRGLAVGAPVPPVLVVSAVSLALHHILSASVARELVTHKPAGGRGTWHTCMGGWVCDVQRGKQDTKKEIK